MWYWSHRGPLALHADTEWLIIDATIIRAHQHAACAKGAADAGLRALPGRVLLRNCMRRANAFCNPLRFIVTGDERHDCTQAQALLDGFHAHAVLADKGECCGCAGHMDSTDRALAVIPMRSNRTILRNYNNALYKERNLLERMVRVLQAFPSGGDSVRQNSALLYVVRPARGSYFMAQVKVDRN